MSLIQNAWIIRDGQVFRGESDFKQVDGCIAVRLLDGGTVIRRKGSVYITAREARDAAAYASKDA